MADGSFYHINRTDFINIDHIVSYSKEQSPIVELKDGTKLIVSEGRKEDFLNNINIFK